MINKLGIDVGGTLAKVAYWRDDQLVLEQLGTIELTQLASWISDNFAKSILQLTGGRARQLGRICSGEVRYVDEFRATCRGVKELLNYRGSALLPPYILCNIGTGTSIYLVESNSYSRVSGTGIGGGTLLGLARVLAGTKDYQEILDMSARGSRSRVDLQVKDIYGPSKTPIAGDLTAANFGKLANLNDRIRPSDYLIGLIGMISETVSILSCQCATIADVIDVVYIGSTLTNNSVLVGQLRDFTEMFSKRPHVLPQGEFSGAVGALL